MKICFLSSMHTPFDKRIYQKEALSLVNDGHSVDHISPSITDVTTPYVNTIRLKPSTSLFSRISLLPKLFFLAIKKRYDVYHCNELDSWFVGLVLKLFTGAKCIFDVHEHYPSDFVESRNIVGFNAKILYSLIESYIFLLSYFTDFIILAKYSLSIDFEHSKKKVAVVANYSNEIDHKLIPDFEIRNDQINLIHVGLINRVRGWPVILEALKYTDDINFTSIGEFNDGSYKDFMSTVSDYDLKEKITVINWLPYKEMMKKIASSDIGIVAFQPNIKNHVMALPHKLFDYMSCGIPVIVPNGATEIMEIISSSNCGFGFESSSSDDLVRALSTLKNHDIRKKLGRNGKVAIRSKYNWGNESLKLVNIYKSICS